MENCFRKAFLLSALLLLQTACAVKVYNSNDTIPQTLETEAQTYRESVTLAQNPTPEKVDDNLVAITPDNKALIWKTIDGTPHVLMSSYVTSFKYYQGYEGKPYNTGNYYTWVTAAPILQNLCQDPQWSDGHLGLRLNQMLGLPPADVKEGFVEMWVNPQDLFRPCPDNEITDSSCRLNLPANTEAWYRKWFNDTRAGQYAFCDSSQKLGYPWTQLGYTFDWKDLNNPVGMSEFVIKANSVVVVKDLTPTDQYCAPGS